MGQPTAQDGELGCGVIWWPASRRGWISVNFHWWLEQRIGQEPEGTGTTGDRRRQPRKVPKLLHSLQEHSWMRVISVVDAARSCRWDFMQN